MNQNINLYLAEFRKKKAWLDAPRMALLTAAAAGVLLLVTGIEYWQLTQRGSSLAVL